MDWGTAKADIIETLKYDGASSKSLTSYAIGTPTDTRLQILLRNFSIETFCFYTRAASVTFQDGDWEYVHLDDFSRCALAMSKVMRMNFNGSRLRELASVGLLERASAVQADPNTGIPAKATPMAWAEAEKGIVSFDVPIDMSASPKAWVAGWHRH